MIASDNAYNAFVIVVEQSLKLFGIVRAACPTQWLQKKRALHKNKLSDERGKQRVRREEIDRVRIKKLAPADLMNTAAQRSMFDMLVIHDAYIKQFNETVSIPRLVRRFLNTVTYGVGVYRTVLGRPGEWSGMRFKQIAKALEDPLCWYTIIIQHKPEKSGSIGRYLPEDFRWMLRMLMDFSSSPLNLLFEPTGVGKRCQMHRLAKQHALVYTLGYESAEPTLMRKFCETAAADPKNELKSQRMEAKVDAPTEVQRTLSLTATMSGHDIKT